MGNSGRLRRPSSTRKCDFAPGHVMSHHDNCKRRYFVRLPCICIVAGRTEIINLCHLIYELFSLYTMNDYNQCTLFSVQS